ncbi:unnamed protein product [Vitrella brassicaformis CCMP3155]|uniref:Uncharacterized protein n=1 Tax=Vitrella brassicaformis (strain CCMP3155) TaxID=1169540 RepID=A0A0G4FNU4_VITBC|nr:unnamed protein product [Vitrella brassicaformis CCMP3155]|eukprot:CEM15857.1 unnamed protein product [Vitrella brassicaformis CCMP3155]
MGGEGRQHSSSSGQGSVLGSHELSSRESGPQPSRGPLRSPLGVQLIDDDGEIHSGGPTVSDDDSDGGEIMIWKRPEVDARHSEQQQEESDDSNTSVIPQASQQQQTVGVGTAVGQAAVRREKVVPRRGSR